jgi:uncharacterized protein with PQ loop repeat
MALSVSPFVGYVVGAENVDFINDVLNNIGILVVSASMALAAFFELLVKKQTDKLWMFLGVTMVLLAVASFVIYGIIEGINVYRFHEGNPPLAFSVAQISIPFLLVVLVLGTCTFIDRKGN